MQKRIKEFQFAIWVLLGGNFLFPGVSPAMDQVVLTSNSYREPKIFLNAQYNPRGCCVEMAMDQLEMKEAQRNLIKRVHLN